MGTEAEKKPSTVDQGLLSAANDCRLEVDLFKKLKLPRNITTINIRPDALLWFKKTSHVILFELTVPRGYRVQEAYEKKLLKYQQLVQQCIEAGWRSWCVPVEVGIRGFPSNSLWRMTGLLGIRGKPMKLIVKMAEAAEYTLSWLWLRSGQKR